MARREATAAVFVLAGVVLAGGQPPRPAADDPTEAARAAVRAYGKNLRAFDRYRCEFTTRLGTAASADAAKAGKLEVRIGGDSTLTVDGRRARQDNHGIPVRVGLAGKKVEPLPGTNLGTVEIDFFKESVYLTNGAEELVHDTGMTVNVFSPDLPASPWPDHPLSTGTFDRHLRTTPDKMADLPAEYDLRGEGPQTLAGRPTVRVRFTARSGDAAWVVDFDPARGHLPYRTQRLTRPDGAKGPLQAESESWVLDAKDCGRGRFYPTRVVTFSPVEIGGPEVHVSETVVRSVDADFKPAADTFDYRPADRTGVIYFRPKFNPSLTLPAGATLRPDDLPGLVKQLKARLPDPER